MSFNIGFISPITPFNLKAVQFNGSTKNMANTGANFSIGASTIEMWIKPTTVASGAGFDVYLSFLNSSNQALFYGAFYQSNFYSIFGVGGASGVIQAGSPIAGNIYHVVIAHNGTNAMKLVVNGTNIGTPTGVASLTGTVTQVYMGSYGASSFYNGSESCASYWNSYLSDTEIIALYDSGNGYKNDKRFAKGNYTSTANLLQQWVPGKDGTSITTMGQSYVSSGGINIGTNSSNITSADIITF